MFQKRALFNNNRHLVTFSFIIIIDVLKVECQRELFLVFCSEAREVGSLNDGNMQTEPTASLLQHAQNLCETVRSGEGLSKKETESTRLLLSL